MVHDLDVYAFALPTVDGWLSGDDRAFVFRVVDGDGTAVDISNATVKWGLYQRPYQSDPADAVLTGDDSGVEIVTDNRVDTTAGVFEVRIDGSATADRWGRYWHRPRVEQADDSVATWRGKVVIEA